MKVENSNSPKCTMNYRSVKVIMEPIFNKPI